MQDYHPVGFCTVPSVPTSVCWHGDSSSVMVTCIGGEVAEIDLSGGHLDSVDSSQVRVWRWVPLLPPAVAIRGGVFLTNSDLT